MTGLLASVRAKFGALGWKDGVLLICKRIVERGSRGKARLIKYRLVGQPIRSAPWLSGRRGATLTVRPVPSDDPVLASLPRPQAVHAERFAQGAECLVAFRGDAPVGFLWFLVGDYQEDEVRCRFRPLPADRTAWDFDVHVAPEHRLSPAFLRLWDAANEILRARSVRWTLSRIDAFNPASLRAHASLGARPLGWLVFLVIGPMQLTLGSQRPRFHLGWKQRSGPLVEVPAGD